MGGILSADSLILAQMFCAGKWISPCPKFPPLWEQSPCVDYNITMETTENNRILQQVMQRYQIGDRFGTEYLKNWYKSEELSNLDLDTLNLSPLRQMYFDFALSTNLRGQDFYNEIAPYLPQGCKRYLDVGCGYGGFMVAFHNHGYEVAGVDISPALVNLSTLNLRDFDINAPVLQADILADGLKEKLGAFDVISCYDVIEHVNDVPTCLEKLVDFLNPGGVLGLKIPNKDSLKFVTRDGHYNLFGITLLQHELACKYHQNVFQTEYEVGEYYPLSYYIRKLEGLGCSTQIICKDHYLRFRQAPGLMIELFQEYRRYQKEIKATLPHEISTALKRGFRKYLSRLLFSFFLPTDVPSFRERYLVDFWTLLAVKKAG